MPPPEPEAVETPLEKFLKEKAIEEAKEKEKEEKLAALDAKEDE